MELRVGRQLPATIMLRFIETMSRHEDDRNTPRRLRLVSLYSERGVHDRNLFTEDDGYRVSKSAGANHFFRLGIVSRTTWENAQAESSRTFWRELARLRRKMAPRTRHYRSVPVLSDRRQAPDVQNFLPPSPRSARAISGSWPCRSKGLLFHPTEGGHSLVRITRGEENCQKTGPIAAARIMRSQANGGGESGVARIS